jgi:hypothetical protein
MRAGTAVALAVAGVVALGAGWYLRGPDAPAATEQAGGALMFPGLAAHLQAAARIEVTHGGKTDVAIARAGGGDAWGLVDRGGYPVVASKLRALLTGLTELRLSERRTADPAEYAKLGVEDPTTQGGTANLLRVLDAQGAPIAQVIVGHRRVRTQSDAPEEVYVRRPDEAQSWLALGRLAVDADPQAWLDHDVLDIGHDRIAAIDVTRGADHLTFAAQGEGEARRLALTAPAEHPPLDDYKVDDLWRGLEHLTLQDVTKSEAQPPGEPVGSAVFSTTDGLRVSVTLFRDKTVLWARFAAAGEAPAVTQLAAKLAPWTYEFPTYREQTLAPSLDDLKASPPPPASSPPKP